MWGKVSGSRSASLRLKTKKRASRNNFFHFDRENNNNNNIAARQRLMGQRLFQMVDETAAVIQVKNMEEPITTLATEPTRNTASIDSVNAGDSTFVIPNASSELYTIGDQLNGIGSGSKIGASSGSNDITSQPDKACLLCHTDSPICHPLTAPTAAPATAANLTDVWRVVSLPDMIKGDQSASYTAENPLLGDERFQDVSRSHGSVPHWLHSTYEKNRRKPRRRRTVGTSASIKRTQTSTTSGEPTSSGPRWMSSVIDIQELNHKTRLLSTSLRKNLPEIFQVSDSKAAKKMIGHSKDAIKKEQSRQKATASCIIHPYSSFVLYWDLFVTVLLMSNLIILPVVISFLYDEFHVHWVIFNCTSDTFFIIDIILRFRMGFVDDDQVVLQPLIIAKHYIKTWFVVDLVSSIPMDYVFLIISGGGNIDQSAQWFRAGRALRILRLAKLLSLLRLLRLARLMRYAQQWQQLMNIATMVMRIFNLICVILLLSHWNACLQFLVPMLDNFPPGCWVSINELETADWFQQYTFALFKALSHMLCIGYGRYPPTSASEMWLTIASMVTGATVYAIFVGHMTMLIQSFDTSRRQYNEKLKQVQEYMCYRKLPRPLRERILDYYEHRYQGKMFDERAIAEELNPCLRQEVISYNCRNLVKAVPFFENADPAFVSELVSALEYEVFLPGDHIIREGTMGDKMYFIQTGIVNIVLKNRVVATSLSDGAYFGEICLLTNARRTASVLAESYCDLWSLKVNAFHQVLNNHPDMKEYMKQVAAVRLEQLPMTSAMQREAADRLDEMTKSSENEDNEFAYPDMFDDTMSGIWLLSDSEVNSYRLTTSGDCFADKV